MKIAKTPLSGIVVIFFLTDFIYEARGEGS